MTTVTVGESGAGMSTRGDNSAANCRSLGRSCGLVMTTGRHGLVGDDFDAEAAGAGAVEFAEEDALPAAEFEFAFGDEDGGGSAHERGLDVGVGVAFGVAVGCGVFWNEAREGGLDIGSDVWVGAFVDDDAGGGVRDVEVADAGVHGGVLDEFGDGGSDVQELGAALGADGEFAGGGVPGFWRCGHRDIMPEGGAEKTNERLFGRRATSE